MSIRQIVSTATEPVSVTELYAKVSGQKHSIRARLHEATSRNEIARLAKGLYIAPGNQVGMKGDSRKAVAELAASGAKFDFAVLDLPWESKGTKGGNRHISRFDTITPLELDKLVLDVKSMLRDENSPILFIFSLGKSSARARTAYQAAIERHLLPAASGEYTKTDKSGKRVQMLGRTIPTEGLWLYTRSGLLDVESIDLDITAIRPSGANAWPTEKPIALLTGVISRSSLKGVALDPFGGSGSTAEACELAGMASLSNDIAHNPVEFRNERNSKTKIKEA